MNNISLILLLVCEFVSYIYYTSKQSPNTIKQTKPVTLLTKQFPQTSIHFPSYIHLHQFIPGTDNSTNQINYNEGYTVTLRTSNINDRIIQASIIESTHFRREEAYIVKYIDPIEQPVIDYDSNPCKSFSFPYCVLQNYDDSDHYSFSYSIFYQSGYVIYIDIDELDIPLNYLNSTLIDSVLLSLHNNETDVFTCTTYSNRLLNGCLIARQSLIRDIITKTTVSKGKLDVLDYIPLYFKEMNRELKVDSMMIRVSLSPYLNVKDKLIPSVFGCDLSENDTSFTVTVPSYRRPKMYEVFEGIDMQSLQPKQVVMIQNTDRLHWNSSLFSNRKTHYYHIWCSNWNSKFYGKHFPGMLYDSTFNFMMDDDRYLTDPQGFKHVMDIIPSDDSVYGWHCGFASGFGGKRGHLAICDHTATIIFHRIKHSKILYRFNWFTYSTGDDLQFSLINYVVCKKKSIQLQVNHTESDEDGFQKKMDSWKTSSLPFGSVTIPNRSRLYIHRTYWDIYDYYIENGFVPATYRNKTFNSTKQFLHKSKM